MGECNQRQERRKRHENAETELQSPLRRGSPDAATSMAAPEFRLHVPPAQGTHDAMLWTANLSNKWRCATRFRHCVQNVTPGATH